MNRKKANNSLQVSGSFLFSNNYQPPQFQQNQNQYRATQLWHKSLETFLTGVPLSQHRAIARFWKVYEASFTGAEAVTWFHEQMKEKFDQEISREQTKKLLGKFYRAGVFCNVDEAYGGDALDEKDFKDSNLQTYRLTMDRPGSPATKSKTPLPKKSSPKMNKNYSVEIVQLSSEQKERVYWELLVESLTSLISSLPTVPPTPNIQANLTTSPSPEVIPSWIIHAMKYLTNYPSVSEHQVNYANFEHDVFFLIFDYFFSYCERVGNFIKDPTLFLTSISNIQTQPSPSKYEEKFPFPRSEFEEIDKIFTPKSANSKRFIMGKNRRRIFDDSFDVKPMGLFDDTRYRSSLYFATSFGVNNSPMTRVLSQNELYAYDNPNLNLSPADLINHPKYGGIRGKLIKGRKSLSVGDLVDGLDDEIESIAPETKRPTIEALSLLLLTLEPDKRKHLEVLLKFMGKIEKNTKLTLDVAVTNKQYLLNYFGRLIIENPSNTAERDLISFFVANVDNLFGGEFIASFKQKVECQITEKQIKKIPALKENKLIFCSQISMSEYEDQRLLGETAKSLRALLDAICDVKDEKLRKKQLKKFRSEYPHIYSEKFNNSSLPQDSPFQQQKSKKRTPFGVLI